MVNNTTVNPNDPNFVANFDFNLTLAAPDTVEEKYTNLAKNADGSAVGDEQVSVSVTLENILGKDTLIGADTATMMAVCGSLNISCMVALEGNLATQNQLDNLNPTQPEVPIISDFVNLSAQLLQNGDLGGVVVTVSPNAEGAPGTTQNPPSTNTQGDAVNDDFVSYSTQAVDSGNVVNVNINVTVDEDGGGTGGTSGTQTPDPDTGDVSGTGLTGGPGGTGTTTTTSGTNLTVQPTGGNRWLAGNAFTTFLVTFSELARLLNQLNEVEGKIQVESMAMIYGLAQNAASSIIAQAKMEQAKDIASAICSGVSMAGSLVSLGGSLKSLGRMEKAPSEESDTAFRNTKADEILAGNKEKYETDWQTDHPDGNSEADLQAFKQKQLDLAKGNAQKTAEIENLYGKEGAEKLTGEQHKNLVNNLKLEQKRDYVMDDVNKQYDKEVDGKKNLLNANGLNAKQVDDRNSLIQSKVQMWQMASQVASSGGQMMTSAVSAAYDVPIAQQQAIQQIIQAIQTIVQQELSTATSTFSSNNDLINQIFSTLSSMKDSLTQAVQASLSVR